MDRRTAVKNIALSLGLVVSHSTLLSLFNSCSTNSSKVEPKFFKTSDLYGIENLVDLILPPTSTPSGNDLSLSYFIDSMCAHVLNQEQQRNMKLGLEEFSVVFQKLIGKSISQGGKDDYQLMLTTYFDISEDNQKEIFNLLSHDVNVVSNASKPKYYLYTYLTTIRELTLLGYFTSQTVMEGHLNA